jgi:hypothetical protein
MREICERFLANYIKFYVVRLKVRIEGETLVVRYFNSVSFNKHYNSYLTNTITRLTHQPSSLRLYSQTANTTVTMLYDVEYIDGPNSSNSYLIQLHSNTPYYMKHIFPGEAPIRKTLLAISHIATFT